jgi:hypothetical protein
MQRTTSDQSGFSLLSVVAALGILLLLYVGVQGLNRVSEDVKEDLIAAPAGSRRTVCLMNRQAISRLLMTWSVTHPGEKATIAKLQRAGIHVPGCPEDGKFTIHGESIECSIHRSEADQAGNRAS